MQFPRANEPMNLKTTIVGRFLLPFHASIQAHDS